MYKFCVVLALLISRLCFRKQSFCCFFLPYPFNVLMGIFFYFLSKKSIFEKKIHWCWFGERRSWSGLRYFIVPDVLCVYAYIHMFRRSIWMDDVGGLYARIKYPYSTKSYEWYIFIWSHRPRVRLMEPKAFIYDRTYTIRIRDNWFIYWILLCILNPKSKERRFLLYSTSRAYMRV